MAITFVKVPLFLKSLLFMQFVTCAFGNEPFFKTVEPQPYGWPLTEEERRYVLKAEHERRPGAESKKYLPQMWPVVPSAGFWGGTSWLEAHSKLVDHVQKTKAMSTFFWWVTA